MPMIDMQYRRTRNVGDYIGEAGLGPEPHGRELRMSNMFNMLMYGWIWTDPEVRGVRQAERRAHADSRGIIRRAHAAGNFMPRQAWSGGL